MRPLYGNEKNMPQNYNKKDMCSQNSKKYSHSEEEGNVWKHENLQQGKMLRKNYTN